MDDVLIDQVSRLLAHEATDARLRAPRAGGRADGWDAITAAGLPLEKSEVIMGEGALRNIGEYDIVVKLHADVQTTVKVVVQAEA